MKRLFRPSLVRRVFFAIVIANARIWSGLFAKQAINYKDTHTKHMPRVIERASYRLHRLSSEPEAMRFAAAWRQVFSLYGWDGAFLSIIEVWTPDNRRIFFDQELAAYPTCEI